MKTHTKKLIRGFTIIEVLIVLAIAGLILAIIFLAVPALQRNSRNTGIRSDAASILSAVDEYAANNQGQLPPAAAASVACAADGTVTVDNTTIATDTPSTAKVRSGTQCNGGGTMPAAGTLGTVSVALGRKCNGNVFETTTTPRAIAGGFRVETGSGDATQCVES